MKPVVQYRESERGSILIFLMVIIAFISLLFTLSVNHYTNAQPLTESFYYENIALDFIDNGIRVIEADLRRGKFRKSYKIDLGEFRALNGSTELKVKKVHEGYEINAKGILRDRNGQEKFVKEVITTGHIEGSGSRRSLKIDSWIETNQ